MERWKRPKLVNIYLMKLDGTDLFKIGYTSNHPNERIRVIRYYFPMVKLVDYALCDFSYEKHFHSLFADKQVSLNGCHEYFRLNQEEVDTVIDFFNSVKSGSHEPNSAWPVI